MCKGFTQDDIDTLRKDLDCLEERMGKLRDKKHWDIKDLNDSNILSKSKLNTIRSIGEILDRIK